MIGDRYATISDLKLRLQWDMTNTSEDARLTDALTCASSAIEQICQRQFNNNGSVATRKYRPDSQWIVTVDDIVDNTGMVVQVNGATWTEEIDYETDPLNGVVNGVPGWPIQRLIALQAGTFMPIWPRKASIMVTANYGWLAVPASVREAALIGAEELARIKDTPFGIGGYGEFGIIKVRDNPFVCRQVEQYMRYPFLAA